MRFLTFPVVYPQDCLFSVEVINNHKFWSYTQIIQCSCELKYVHALNVSIDVALAFSQ